MVPGDKKCDLVAVLLGQFELMEPGAKVESGVELVTGKTIEGLMNIGNCVWHGDRVFIEPNQIATQTVFAGGRSLSRHDNGVKTIGVGCATFHSPGCHQFLNLFTDFL